MKDQFMDALRDVAEVMKFENWLRFYFVQEEADMLFVRVPEEAQQYVRENYPQYFEIVESLHDKEINPEKSRSTVCTFVLTRFDGPKYGPNVVQKVLDSREFQTEMQLFAVWQQAHEDQLEQAPMGFDSWIDIYEKWKSSDQVQEHFEQVRKGEKPGTQSCATKTVQ